MSTVFNELRVFAIHIAHVTECSYEKYDNGYIEICLFFHFRFPLIISAIPSSVG